jgi:hypothetical protein
MPKQRSISMELLPAELRERLPALYSQERNPDAMVHLKFFTPDSNWTWFVTEGESQDGDFLFSATSSASKRNGDTSFFRN